MVVRLGAREARNQFSDMIGRVHYGGDVVIVERSGRPMAAVVPVEVYERYLAEREKDFAVIDELRRAAPDVPADEVEADVVEAIAHVRAQKS